MKKITVLILVAVIGLALRVYNLDSPSIGYHDMRENEALSIAKEMSRSGNYALKKVYFYNAFEDEPGIVRNKEIPLISYQTLLAWRVFGENLWGPRLLNVAFGVLGVIAVYLIAAGLFPGFYIPAFCALLCAVLPVLTFFSRNLQPDIPAFFFMLLGNLFYLRFIKSGHKKYNLVLGGAAFAAAGIYQGNFLIGIFPFLFCFSADTYKNDPLKFLAALLVPYLAAGVMAGTLISGDPGPWHNLSLSGLPEIFSPGYWRKYGFAVWRYMSGENFPPPFLALTGSGALLACFSHRGILERYLIGWMAALIPYAMIFSRELPQQSYFQIPFAGFVCLSAGYFLFRLKAKARNVFIAVLALALTGVSIPLIFRSMEGMRSTVFMGLDVAGESLKALTKPDERVFLYTHAQGNGIARYAQRYMGWPADLEDFKSKEEKFGIRYLCFYPIEYAHMLKTRDPAWFKYIEDNYRVKEVGFAQDVSQTVYMIARKGREEADKGLLEGFDGKTRLRTIYRLFGRFVFFYTASPND